MGKRLDKLDELADRFYGYLWFWVGVGAIVGIGLALLWCLIIGAAVSLR